MSASDFALANGRAVNDGLQFFQDIFSELKGSIMRVLIGGVVLALLAGCSLPASVVPGEPNLNKFSEKPPKEYAACVLPVWQHEVSGSTQSSISNGYRITAPSVITADEIVDIVKSKNGSRVSLYQGPPWAKSGDLRKAVRDCL